MAENEHHTTRPPRHSAPPGYGDTPQAQVRLITCAWEYDRRAKDYTDNLVVFAHLL